MVSSAGCCRKAEELDICFAGSSLRHCQRVENAFLWHPASVFFSENTYSILDTTETQLQFADGRLILASKTDLGVDLSATPARISGDATAKPRRRVRP